MSVTCERSHSKLVGVPEGNLSPDPQARDALGSTLGFLCDVQQCDL